MRIPFFLLFVPLLGCVVERPLEDRDGGTGSPFVCESADDDRCEGRTYLSCVATGTRLDVARTTCAGDTPVCVPEVGCRACVANSVGCFLGQPANCRSDGSGWDITGACNVANGEACMGAGRCMSLCDVARDERSYTGCEFWPVDLDNSAEGTLSWAAAQQFAVIVSNPSPVVAQVVVELNEAELGAAPRLREIARVTIAPGDLEAIPLPQREVDGSRDGRMGQTHTAVTPHAYRLTSNFPVVTYQFNPLENVSVYSNDASLLLPTSAIGNRYTINGWPQTIPSTGVPITARAFLTVVGVSSDTQVTVTLGERARTVGAGAIPAGMPGDVLEVRLGAFEVLNLETADLGDDLTGTVVTASSPVVVYAGSEIADVPFLEEGRLCCADHLEEQMIPDASLGSRFVLAPSPSRTRALNDAFVSSTDRVAEVDEPEYFRIVAVRPGTTEITTTLPAPNDRFTLEEREERTLRLTRNAEMTASQPVSVVQLMAGQEAVGLTGNLPGGDPSSIVVPPIDQYRRDYVFLTPDRYAFDFVTLVAPRDAQVLLDGEALGPTCIRSDADGVMRGAGDAPSDRVVYRCQLSFPEVLGGPDYQVTSRGQNDGVHTVLSDVPIGVVVSGFDTYVSYGYPGGLDLQPLL